MDKDKFESLPSKVGRGYNVELETEFIDPHYEAAPSVREETTPSGWLVIFTVRSGDTSLPNFVGRWDDGGRTLDIDPDPPDMLPRELWKAERGGYQGHHATLVGTDARVYAIDIRIPSCVIFKGRVRFNLSFSESVIDTVKLETTTSCTVVRAGQVPTPPSDNN